MVLTVLALHRHRIRHGVYPDGLEQLIPELLSEEPKDWMDGEVLRYGVQPDGEFLLYSVGQDCVDDGGDPRSDDSETTYRQLHQGRDAAWPVAATDEEVRDATQPTP